MHCRTISFLLLSRALAIQAFAQPTARPLLESVAQAPALAAARHRLAAAEARIDSSGRLADPELEGSTSRLNGPMGERRTMYELNIRQPLPKRGERAADRERARAGAAMARADYAVMAGELAAETAMALAEAEGAHQRIHILETQLGRLDPVLRTIEARRRSADSPRRAPF